MFGKHENHHKTMDASYWYKSKSQYFAWFHDMLDRKCSRVIRIVFFFLHSVDNRTLTHPGEARYDPYTKILPMVNDVSRVCQNRYTLWLVDFASLRISVYL
jgi:hypothetical protein